MQKLCLRLFSTKMDASTKLYMDFHPYKPAIYQQSIDAFLLLMLNVSLFTSVMYGVQCNLIGSTLGSFTGCFFAKSSKCIISAYIKYAPLTNLSIPRVFNAKITSSAKMEVFFAMSRMLIPLLPSESCNKKPTMVEVQYGMYACWPKSLMGFLGDPTFSSFLLSS